MHSLPSHALYEPKTGLFMRVCVPVDLRELVHKEHFDVDWANKICEKQANNRSEQL